MANTTKKQHYVWRKYLVPWTDNGCLETGKVFVHRKVPKGTQRVIESRELMKIAFENYYYDISGFNAEDISVYKQFFEYIQREQRIKWGIDFDNVNIAKTQKDFIEKEVMCSIENIDNKHKFLEKLYACNISFYEDSVGQEILSTLRNAIFESILLQKQALSDNEIVEMTEKFIQNMDNPDLKYNFNLFLSVQYFRSPRIHLNLTNSFEEFKKLSGFSSLSSKFHVNLLTLYFAETMALNMTHNHKSSIILYNNKSSIPFITGDTPIVNISDKEDITMLHYPITPTIAVNIICSNVLLKNIVIQIDDSLKEIVDVQNKKLYVNCVNEVYSSNQYIFAKL